MTPRLLDERNGPEWDLPSPQELPRSYLVASSPRTGSTLLCRALWDTGLVGAPKEYLNPMQLRDWELRLGGPISQLRHAPLDGPLLALVGRTPWPDERLRRHLDRVRQRRSSGGWFGMKLHWHHNRRWFGDSGPSPFLGELTVIHVTRADRVAQAVSWERAMQTGSWASFQGERRPPRYSHRAISRRLAAVEAAEQGWRALFEREGIRPLRLTYEEIATNLQGSTRRALSHLGVSAASQVRIAPPGLQRQADQLSHEWATRFRDEG